MITIVSTLVLLLAGLIMFDGVEFNTLNRCFLFAAVIFLRLLAMLTITGVGGTLSNSPRNIGVGQALHHGLDQSFWGLLPVGCITFLAPMDRASLSPVLVRDRPTSVTATGIYSIGGSR